MDIYFLIHRTVTWNLLRLLLWAIVAMINKEYYLRLSDVVLAEIN